MGNSGEETQRQQDSGARWAVPFEAADTRAPESGEKGTYAEDIIKVTHYSIWV